MNRPTHNINEMNHPAKLIVYHYLIKKIMTFHAGFLFFYFLLFECMIFVSQTMS